MCRPHFDTKEVVSMGMDGAWWKGPIHCRSGVGGNRVHTLLYSAFSDTMPPSSFPFSSVPKEVFLPHRDQPWASAVHHGLSRLAYRQKTSPVILPFLIFLRCPCLWQRNSKASGPTSRKRIGRDAGLLEVPLTPRIGSSVVVKRTFSTSPLVSMRTQSCLLKKHTS